MTTMKAAFKYAEQKRDPAKGIHVEVTSFGRTDRFRKDGEIEDYAILRVLDNAAGKEIELVFRDGAIYEFVNGHKWSDDVEYSPSTGVKQRPHVILFATEDTF